MKPVFAVASILFAAAALTACDDPAPVETDMVEAPVEPLPEAPAAEDAGVETAAPVAETPQPDPGALPADKRTSEESVQPESETLFY